MRHVKENGLSIGFGLLFLIALGLQAIAGYNEYNNDALAHATLLHEPAETISFGRYLTSSSFGQAVMENWQSEYLQFSLFILGTIWLLQRGSPESKELDKAGLESDQKQRIGGHADPRSPRWARAGGLRTFVYSNSLLIVMTSIFFALVVRALGDRLVDLQRRPARAPPGRAVMDPVSGQRRLLAVHPPELAVRVPRRRLDGDPVGVSAPARLPRVQAGGLTT